MGVVDETGAPATQAPPQTIAVEVGVYVCPTPGCGNYYGSSSMTDLAKAKIEPPVDNKDSYRKAHGGDTVKFTRDECPDCRQRGKSVPRQLVKTTLVLANQPAETR